MLVTLITPMLVTATNKNNPYVGITVTSPYVGHFNNPYVGYYHNPYVGYNNNPYVGYCN